MQHHLKQYEDVFSSNKKNDKNPIRIEKISIEGMETEEYRLLFKDFLKQFYDDLFMHCVRLSWLRRKFTYAGKGAKMPIYTSTRFFQGQFIKFLRGVVGNDIQVITKSYFFPKLETYYFNTLFPGFEDGNPFTNPDYYRFPFKNISLEYLPLVYQLDDRFELLKEADSQKMAYDVFLNYVINHIKVENEILGRERYTLTQGTGRACPYHFVDLDKRFRSRKGDKRI